MNRAAVAAARRQMDPQPSEMPYDPVFPVAAYALATQRHMAQYGTTREQLAAVAVAARDWARKNPDAFSSAILSLTLCLYFCLASNSF
jgi:acetyl-CoA acetyltransferase